MCDDASHRRRVIGVTYFSAVTHRVSPPAAGRRAPGRVVSRHGHQDCTSVSCRIFGQTHWDGLNAPGHGDPARATLNAGAAVNLNRDTVTVTDSESDVPMTGSLSTTE